jgi:hypothetical protein
MPIARADVTAALAIHDPAELQAILRASGVDARGAITARELAERVAEALWWHATTPLGYVTERTSFEDIVQRVARRTGMGHHVDASTDGWTQLASLTAALFRDLPGAGIGLDALDDATRARLEPNWMPTLGLGLGSGGSATTAFISGRALALLKGPFGRLLPLIPPLAPYYRALVGTLGAVQLVAWPLTIALGVLSVNSALGANDRKLVPLLLGVGALAPNAMDEAFEVP